MRRSAVMALALAGLLSFSCDGGPEAGEIVLLFDSPNGADGAAMFLIVARAPNAVIGIEPMCAGCQAFLHQTNDQNVTGIVTGDLTSGAIARVAVSNARVRSAYAVSLLEVAAQNFNLRSTAGYTLVLEP